MNVNLDALKGLMDELDIRKLMEDVNGQEKMLQLEQITQQLSVKDTVTLSGNNPMGRNFVGSTEDSKYVEAAKNAHAAEQDVKNMMSGNLMDYLGSAVREAAYWEGNTRMRQARQMKETSEAHEGILDEIEDQIEERVEAANTNDNPTGAQTQDTGSGVASTPSTPNIAPQPASAAASTATTTAPTDVTVPLTQSAQPAPALPGTNAPSAASLDITV